MPNNKTATKAKLSKSPATTKAATTKAATTKALASKSPATKAATPKKAALNKSPTPVSASAPAPPVDVVVTEPSAPSAGLILQDDFAGILSKLQQLTGIVTGLRGEIRTLEKKAAREIKSALKSRPKPRKGSRAPSGFVMPAKISNELASFLGKDQGTEMARTEVTREINAYIRQHNLQDSSNGRKINPDESLSKLLKIGATDELTYFNLQRYMSPHFESAAKKAAAKAAAAAGSNVAST
jgi:chromatin remodeling complex protein RSC6